MSTRRGALPGLLWQKESCDSQIIVIYCCCLLCNCVGLFETPWTAACQASPSLNISQGLLKLMSIELVMPSNHLILSLHSSPVIYNQNIHLVFIPISGPELLKPLTFPKKCHKGFFCSVHAVTFGKPQVTYAWGLVTRGSNYVIRGLEFIVTNPQDWEGLGRRLNCYQWPVV